MAKVLIVDDDKTVCQSIASVVERLEHEPVMVSSLKEAVTRCRQDEIDLVYLDVRMPDGNGLEILPTLRDSASSPEVIIMTGYGDPDGAELAIKNGAWDYLEKPASVQTMMLPLKRALEYREKKRSRAAPTVLKRDRVVGESGPLRACLSQVAQAAGSEADVLITGETGTGKEVLALTIHENSARANGNFVVVDCAALPENLVESVLFGHEKGAFTGASATRKGLVHQADGGTLFLDEVAELPLSIQKSFLRVLQERSFRSVGANTEDQSDFRLLAATNQDIDVAVENGTFRQDLLFRLQGFKIELPPLRERREDIKLLTRHYISELCERYRMDQKGFSPDFLDELMRYDWPGNVRELVQALEKSIATAQNDPVLFPAHLPTHIRVRIKRAAVKNTNGTEPLEGQLHTEHFLDENGPLPPLKKVRNQAIARVEQQYLRKLMATTGGDVKQAIRISGLSRSRLYTLLKEHDISTKP
jgi:two-component system NtrC family response regulator